MDTLYFLVPLALPVAVTSFLVSRYISNVRYRSLQARKALAEILGIKDLDERRLVGFFHPYCNAGGGGERVLWTAIASIQRNDPDIISIVYSGDTDASKNEIISKVKSRFDITLSPDSLHFVFLESRHLVEESYWPRFTILGQSLGSMFLAWEAMTKLIPDLYIDTMGYAFTFHVAIWLGGIPVGAYVHYPTISTDMLERVRSRKQWHTNSDTISSSSTLSRGKLIYYRLFMYYYALSLRSASFLMVNSSWTKNHVDSILAHSDPLLDAVHLLPPLLFLKLFFEQNAPQTSDVVYPPCDTKEVAQFALQRRERVILSVAQFRPEKDHAAQLRSFKALLDAHPQYRQGESAVKMVLVGGSRNEGDARRVESLRALANELMIENSVEFVVNASYRTVLDWLSRANIGLSTMVDEHFGINIVEFMAAGVIPVIHASGGPKNDIVVPYNGEPTGYHATSPESFAEAIHTVFTLDPMEELALRQRARSWAVERFSESEFDKGWNANGWKDWLPE